MRVAGWRRTAVALRCGASLVLVRTGMGRSVRVGRWSASVRWPTVAGHRAAAVEALVLGLQRPRGRIAGLYDRLDQPFLLHNPDDRDIVRREVLLEPLEREGAEHVERRGRD